MKKLTALLLALLLTTSLCSCGEAPDSATVPQTETAAQPAETLPPEPAGVYDPDSSVEKQSGGALKAYPLYTDGSMSLIPMGEDLLVFRFPDTTGTEVICYGGKNLYEKDRTVLPGGVFDGDPDLVVLEDGLSYYDEFTHAQVILDKELEEVRRINLPIEADPMPTISRDLKTLYYTSGGGIYAMDTESGLSRLLRETDFTELYLSGIFCNGRILACTTYSEPEGVYGSLWLSAETGETVQFLEKSGYIRTHGEDFYFGQFMEDSRQRTVFGTKDAPLLEFFPEDPGAMILPMTAMEGAVTVRFEDDGTNDLWYYDLNTATQKAHIVLENSDYPWSICGRDGAIWLGAYSNDYGCDVIYCWDPEESAVDNTAVYADRYYTRDDPDLEGLQRCADLAAEIGRAHGVEIRIWEDAVSYQPMDYTMIATYMVPVIEESLYTIDQALDAYPAGFLELAAEGSGSGPLKICIVDSLQGVDGTGSLESAVGLQYWDDDNGMYIAVIPGSEMVQTLYHEICHVLDNRILSTCDAYDRWENLNPPDFSYDYDYIANLERTDETYILGDQRAFIDLYSMSYPKEDRARIMEYGMTPDHATYFETQIMQDKLCTISKAIRKAYGLDGPAGTYLWEQYILPEG